MSRETAHSFDKPHSLAEVFRTEWRWWVLGGLLSFVLASILMTGWPKGVWPDLSFPYIYQGDGLSHSWLALRAIEGWIFDNPRSGYPFGSNFLDYPGSDAGNLLVLKALGALTGEYYSALNLFFLLSFSVVFCSAFCVLRALGMWRLLAFSAALLFAFLPFHFQRLGHLFYLWYFVVPIFFYLGFLIFLRQEKQWLKSVGVVKAIFIATGFVLLSSFGVYYALFGVLVLATAAVLYYVKSLCLRSLVLPSLLVVLVVAGVFANVAPNLVNRIVNGPNPEVAVRSPAEAEIYGLKFMQLVLPRLGHRIDDMAGVTSRYSESYPIVNENSTATLGVIGSLGFLSAFLILLAGAIGRKIDSRLALLAALVLVLFMFGTIGGFGALFSAIVSPSIRGWNRISIFIAFGSIAIFFFTLQFVISRFFSIGRSKVVVPLSALLVGCVGLYDQTTPSCVPCNEQTKAIFNQDREFVSAIERLLPPGSAIYQLPYLPFPEVAPLHRLHTYDLSVGFLHSRELRWSYAGMKGRQGDLFYRALAQESIGKQVDVILRLGFSGIYIDRRGFEDRADLLIEELTRVLGDGPALKRADGEVVFFKIEPSKQIDLDDMSALNIMKVAGFVVDNLGPRHAATLSEGVDFTRRTWPEFIKNVQGLSGLEPWGRWSDADISRSVRFVFFEPLPTHFTLHLTAQPFGRNGVQEVIIKIGDQSHVVKLRGGDPDIRLPIVLTDGQVDAMEFVPHEPVSPKELGVNADIRRLGIGFVRLRFEE